MECLEDELICFAWNCAQTYNVGSDLLWNAIDSDDGLVQDSHQIIFWTMVDKITDAYTSCGPTELNVMPKTSIM